MNYFGFDPQQPAGESHCGLDGGFLENVKTKAAGSLHLHPCSPRNLSLPSWPRPPLRLRPRSPRTRPSSRTAGRLARSSSPCLQADGKFDIFSPLFFWPTALTVRVLRTRLGGAVDVLDGERRAQAVQQHLGQGRDELGGGDQHIYTVGPVSTETVF